MEGFQTMTNAEMLLKRLIADKILSEGRCHESADKTSIVIFGMTESALDETESLIRRSRAFRSIKAPIIRRLTDGQTCL